MSASDRPRLKLFSSTRAPGSFIADSKIVGAFDISKLKTVLELLVKTKLEDVDVSKDLFSLAPDTTTGRNELARVYRFCEWVIQSLALNRVKIPDARNELVTLGLSTESTELILNAYLERKQDFQEKIAKTDYIANQRITGANFRLDIQHSDVSGRLRTKPVLHIDLDFITPAGKTRDLQFEADEEIWNILRLDSASHEIDCCG